MQLRSIAGYSWVDFPGPAIDPATQRLHLLETLIAHPNGDIQGTDTGVADSDNVRLRVQFLKDTRGNFAHRHQFRPGDLCRRKLPRLANIQQDQAGFSGFKLGRDIASA